MIQHSNTKIIINPPVSLSLSLLQNRPNISETRINYHNLSVFLEIVVFIQNGLPYLKEEIMLNMDKKITTKTVTQIWEKCKELSNQYNKFIEYFKSAAKNAKIYLYKNMYFNDVISFFTKDNIDISVMYEYLTRINKLVAEDLNVTTSIDVIFKIAHNTRFKLMGINEKLTFTNKYVNSCKTIIDNIPHVVELYNTPRMNIYDCNVWQFIYAFIK